MAMAMAMAVDYHGSPRCCQGFGRSIFMLRIGRLRLLLLVIFRTVLATDNERYWLANHVVN